MIISSIELKNYRNYDEIHIDLDRNVNILFGDNAQGKTNILEAVYVCATTKSHRLAKDRDIIRFGEDESHIKMIVDDEGISTRIDMHLKKNKNKGIAIDGLSLKRASDLFGRLNVVFFSPEDLQIIKSGPSERRRFIDSELCQIDRIYLNNIVSFNRILDQRNRILKDINFRPDYEELLDVVDMQLVQFGAQVIEDREKFVKELGEIILPVHDKLTGGKEKLEIVYEKDVEISELEEALKKGRARDIKNKSTGNGPHRDDLRFCVGGIDIRKYGSQGQQRTAALSVKLAEISLVEKITGKKPVLLLDDVLSELDSSRQRFLLESIEGIQTLITCTGLDDFVDKRFDINRVYRVVQGHIIEKNMSSR
ncbi:MAG: DNA replication/repair protein RecF [Lachnospiraceae bacterium]|nr:DNA replication/repair protein RecF [Lachnospiraceae bacterium]